MSERTKAPGIVHGFGRGGSGPVLVASRSGKGGEKAAGEFERRRSVTFKDTAAPTAARTWRARTTAHRQKDLVSEKRRQK